MAAAGGRPYRGVVPPGWRQGTEDRVRVPSIPALLALADYQTGKAKEAVEALKRTTISITTERRLVAGGGETGEKHEVSLNAMTASGRGRIESACYHAEQAWKAHVYDVITSLWHRTEIAAHFTVHDPAVPDERFLVYGEAAYREAIFAVAINDEGEDDPVWLDAYAKAISERALVRANFGLTMSDGQAKVIDHLTRSYAGWHAFRTVTLTPKREYVPT